MNWSAALALLVPAGVVTVMSTVPLPAGEVAVIWVALLTVKPVAAVAPNLTAVAPLNLVPVIVTLVPPADGPDDGLTAVTAAFEGLKKNGEVAPAIACWLVSASA